MALGAHPVALLAALLAARPGPAELAPADTTAARTTAADDSGDVDRSSVASPSVAAEGRADAPKHHLIDMVVAQVDATVITLSELVAETRLVLLWTSGPELARAGRLGQGLLNSVLRGVVSRELLLGELRRLKLEDVPDHDVAHTLETIRTAFATAGDYERFLERTGFREPGTDPRGEAPRSLVAIVAAELAVERFLDGRIRARISVSESDIALCLEVNRAAFAQEAIEVSRQRVRERLLEQRERRALEALLDQLEEKATIRYAPGFEAKRPREESALGFDCPEPTDHAARTR